MELDPTTSPGLAEDTSSPLRHIASETRLPGQRISRNHPEDPLRPPARHHDPSTDDTIPEIRLPDQRISSDYATGPSWPPARGDEPDTDDDAVERIARLLARWELGSVYRLRAAAHRAWLSCNEYLVLAEIGVRPHGLTGAQVAGIVGLSTGGVTRILARLEEQELVERDLDPEDGRQIVAFATEAGLALVRDEEGDPSGPGVRQLLYGLGPDVVGDVRTFLGRATDRAYRQSRHLRDLRRRRDR